MTTQTRALPDLDAVVDPVVSNCSSCWNSTYPVLSLADIYSRIERIR